MTDRPTRFILLASERTGSTLLARLLHSHPEIFVGREIFNQRLIETGEIPWYIDDVPRHPELLEQRRSDPIAFLNHLFGSTAKHGFRAIGFKLMYNHGERHQAVRDYLASDSNLRVIHIKRRNLLRRYLSNERARATNTWSRQVGTVDHQSPPPVHLDFMNCLHDFAYNERMQAEYEERFRDHERLEVAYEDLAQDPQAVGAAAATFLGASPGVDLQVLEQKSGTGVLPDAITNYDELKARIERWAAFFDD